MGFVPQGKFIMFWWFIPYNKSFIDQACLVKMAGYWPRSFFACLWTSTSTSINTQKKNLANIHPSWPHPYIVSPLMSRRIKRERGRLVLSEVGERPNNFALPLQRGMSCLSKFANRSNRKKPVRIWDTTEYSLILMLPPWSFFSVRVFMAYIIFNKQNSVNIPTKKMGLKIFIVFPWCRENNGLISIFENSPVEKTRALNYLSYKPRVHHSYYNYRPLHSRWSLLAARFFDCLGWSRAWNRHHCRCLSNSVGIN